MTSPRSLALARLACLAWLAVALAHLPPAAAAVTRKLIVTLETPADATPESFCVISDQRCYTAYCAPLADIADTFALVGGVIQIVRDPVRAEVGDEHLRAALQSLRRGPLERCHQCQPELVHLPAFGSLARPDGFISCATNRRPTGNTRVAVAYLEFHKRNVPAPIGSIELVGNQATIHFSHPIDGSDYELLASIGGDYLPDTTGLGTKERMTLPLTPRCTASPIALPSRVPVPGERLAISLDGEPIGACLAPREGALSVWLPHRSATAEKVLQLAFASAASSSRYEARWTASVPPSPVRPRHREVELAWRRDCLAGTLPVAPPAPPPPRAVPGPRARWSAACPAATLPTAGAPCQLVAEDTAACRYRCTAAPGTSAFELPTPVRFDRVGMHRAPHGTEEVTAYGWDDTLAHSGQVLTSFLPPLERRIVVALERPHRWSRRPGNAIERVEISGGAGAPQVLRVGDSPPDWAVIAAPNAACSDRFTIRVVGSIRYERRTQGLSESGNLVLGDPESYRYPVHWLVVAGGGVLLPQGYRVGGRGLDRVIEPHGSAGIGAERYFERTVSGALELTLLFEPSRTHFGALRREGQGVRIVPVSYARVVTQLGASIWLDGREQEVGLLVGGGLGGPTGGEFEKVGTLRFFGAVGGFYRVRLARAGLWSELGFGVRFGEEHHFFGSDTAGDVPDRTFHGEPGYATRRLTQPYIGLRLRGLVR